MIINCMYSGVVFSQILKICICLVELCVRGLVLRQQEVEEEEGEDKDLIKEVEREGNF